MLGLSFEKLLLIILVAALVVGPERLPRYAEKLADLVRALRDVVDTARTRAHAGLGSEFDPAEWKKLDPRQYDPRRIIQEALADTPTPAGAGRADAVEQPNPAPVAPVARGGWQEAMLARVSPTPADPGPVPQEEPISVSPTGS